MVYAHDLKSCPERDVGSMPTPGTKKQLLYVYRYTEIMKDKKKILQGTIRVIGKGVGYFPIPEADEDFEIQPENLAGALNNDTVEVEDLGKESYGRKQARVVSIIERKKMKFVGTIDSDNGNFFLYQTISECTATF